MSYAGKTWTMRTVEKDGTTTVSRGLNQKEAAAEIYRAMYGRHPRQEQAAPVAPRAEAREKIAA